LKVDDARFKRWEIYSGETVEAPIIVRIDGNNFHKLTAICRMAKPFDERFHLSMVGTAEDLMINIGFNISLAYTASDEISLLFLKNEHLPYNGRIEKILSVISSYASSSLQNHLRDAFSYSGVISFDARIVKVHTQSEILEYFSWRCLESFRNFLNSYAQQIIGCKKTFRMKGEEIVKELHLRGFHIQEAPQWQKHGTMIYWRRIVKKGYNPITEKEVSVKRRKIFFSSIDLSSKEGRKELENIIREI